MNRTEIIQRVIDQKNARSYLEIGVNDGRNFFPLRARQKTAVDPQFAFSRKQRLAAALANPHNLTATYHASTSDGFFETLRPSARFDVIFIDGLHTYAQSLRDMMHALAHLAESGVILMHDCNPPNAGAALPAPSYKHVIALNLPGWNGEWCGDVWKTVCFLRSQRPDLRTAVLDCDFGIGIVTQGAASDPLKLDRDTLDTMTYADLARDRKTLLDLRDEPSVPDFLASL